MMTLPKEELASWGIGIFDSGFGGLTVMRAICQLLPKEKIIYFGDTARLPYGSKGTGTILRYSLENAHFLADQGIKLLVIACNTSCSVALTQIRNTFDIPVIGIVELGVEETIRLVPEGKIAILGTQATIASKIYQTQIHQRQPLLELFPVSCPLFVPLVEEGYHSHLLSQLVAQEYLNNLREKKIQGALLGCTHYPLLRTVIQQEIGNQVLLIDPAMACAQKARQLLKEKGLLNLNDPYPKHQFFVSDDPEKFRLLGAPFLGQAIDHINHVRCDEL